MSQPQIVQSALGGEAVVTRLGLGGEDELYATPTRTLVYRAEGLLSDESVEEYPHDAERVTVSEGRRKSKVTLEYGLDGSETFALPSKYLDRALHPLVEGVLKANGILKEEESVERLFRFSELTLVVAGTRVVRHIGSSLWDEDYEEYRYEDVTDLTFEDGSVATSVVMTVGDRQERFKTPNEDARAVREALESTLLDYWGVASLEELRAANEPEDEEPAETDEVSFGDGPDPLSANPAELSDEPKNATRDAESETETESESSHAAGQQTAEVRTEEPGTAESQAAETTTADADATNEQTAEASAEASAGANAAPSAGRSASETESASDERSEPSAADARPEEGDARKAKEGANADAGFENSGFESAGPVAEDALADEVAALRETVEAQGEEIRRQQELIEQLIEELRRGR
ncbi:DUF7115 domain-containing protein [Halopelagius longus]|uniref:DUF7115 domain-containing protein n=1 Tax=Halopelagius longus TaxID=1236180 RepID=A0A1H0YN98_9EURY|nr:hypothetical protein [Halopelagius longus]RDI72587.1 hypothetical protein DWB78_13140 [Halopelagius longus]SDQ16674.1 hypothetical protein SAMN05216278_0743 [Halopelagius longus]